MPVSRPDKTNDSALRTAALSRVELRPLSTLLPHPRNPRTHDLAAIRASVERFGIVGPAAAVDGRTGYLILGHGRVEVLRSMHKYIAEMLSLGFEAPPIPAGVMLDSNGIPNGDWLVPVGLGWSSRDDEEAFGALIALNRVSELGGWDEAELLAELEAVAAAFDPQLAGANPLSVASALDPFAGTGFSAFDMDDLAVALDSAAASVAPAVPAPAAAAAADASSSWQSEVWDDTADLIDPALSSSSEGADADSIDLPDWPATDPLAAKYAAQRRRLVVLTYPLTDYTTVISLLDRVRADRGFTSNSEAILTLIREAVTSHEITAPFDSTPSEEHHD